MHVQLPIKNFPAQDTIFDSPVRYKVVSKGRRFGLTRGKANNFIKNALAKKFSKGLWVDTVNQNIDRYVERYFIPALRKLPEGMWEWKKIAKTLYIRDAYIDFRSADRPENIEGFGYDDVFLNEAGIILKNEYLWNNAIRPMLWDYSAPALIGGTPKVGTRLFKELADRGMDKNQKEYQFFRYSTFDNPYINPDELREEIKSMPERVVQQEIYGEFLDDDGVVFRGVRECCTASPQPPKSGHLYVMGVDLAKVQDFTVITVYDRSTNCQVYQDRFQTLEWPFQKKKIKTISQHFNNSLVIIDATGLGDPIADDLARDNVPIEAFKLTNQSKKELIEKMVLWIEQRRIQMLNIPETVNEFLSFTYDVSSTGRISYNAPQGFHDDIVIANSLAVWGLTPLSPKEAQGTPTRLQEFRQKLLNPSDGEDELIAI